MVLELKNGKMVQFTKVNGNFIRPMAGVSFTMSEVTIMKASG